MEDKNMKSLQMTVLQVLVEKQQIIDELEKELSLWQNMVIEKEKELQIFRKHQLDLQANGIQQKSKCEIGKCIVRQNQLKPKKKGTDQYCDWGVQCKQNKKVSFGQDEQLKKQKKVKKIHD